MDKIDSLDKINGFVSDIRSLRKGYLSNFFLDRKKHSIWTVSYTHLTLPTTLTV